MNRTISAQTTDYFQKVNKKRLWFQNFEKLAATTNTKNIKNKKNKSAEFYETVQSNCSKRRFWLKIKQ